MAMTLEEILKRNEEKKKQGGYKDRPVRPPSGKSVWRIMPGWDENEPLVFFHAFGQHYLKGIDGKIRTVVGCNDRTYDKPCEICDMLGEAVQNSSDDDSIKALKDMKSSLGYLVNAVQVDKDKTEPKILLLSKTLFETSLMDSIAEYGAEMLDLQEGNDIVISREGTGLDTKYSLIVRSQAKSTPIDKSVFQKATDLNEYVKDDFEAKKQKAIDTIGEHLGELPSMSGGYGGPGMSIEDKSKKDADFGSDEDEVSSTESSETAKIEDDLAGYDGVEDAVIEGESETKTASAEEKKEAESTFNDDISEDDLDDILAKI